MPRSPSLSPRAALQSPDIYRGGIIQSQTMQQTSCSPLSLASPGGPVADWMWQGQPASPSSPDCGRTVLMLTPRGTHYQRVHTGPGSPAGAASPEQKDSRPDMAVPVDGVTDEQHEAFSQVLGALRARRGGLREEAMLESLLRDAGDARRQVRSRAVVSSQRHACF
jgi:hypothetical protein